MAVVKCQLRIGGHMKLTNLQLYKLDRGLGELVQLKVKGGFKFKIYKMVKQLSDCLEPVQEALKGIEDTNERIEILNETQEVHFDKFQLHEIEDLEISTETIINLEPVIDFEGDENV